MPYASKKYIVSSRRIRLLGSASALAIEATSPLWQRLAPGGPEVLDTLERFVLERLRPRTYSDQTTIDALIREAEGRD